MTTDRKETTVTTTSFEVRGVQLRSHTKRRYIAVAVRPEPVLALDASGATVCYVAFAHVLKRSDNLATVATTRRRYNNDKVFANHGEFAVVIDTTTGEEV